MLSQASWQEHTTIRHDYLPLPLPASEMLFSEGCHALDLAMAALAAAADVGVLALFLSFFLAT